MRVAVLGARGIPNVEGGAEKNAEMLFPRITKQHAVTLYAVSGNCGIREYRGVEIVPVIGSRLLGTDKLPCYLYATAKIFRTRPEIVHCQGLGSAIFLLLYKLFGRKVVVRYGSVDYEMDKWSWIGRLGFRACEWQLRFADAVIAVAPSLKRRLIDRGYKVRIELIPNALDPMDEIGTDVDKVLEAHGLTAGNYALGIGRLTAQKDFDTLIRGFQSFRHKGGARFEKLVIVGGDDGSGCARRLRQLGDEAVVFTGRLPRPEVRALLSRCGVYVNSSVHEGMSNAVLEAISADCPVILSDIVENRDLPVGDAHFFRVGDATALGDLLARVEEAPRDFVVPLEPFLNWEQVADRTLALYEALVGPEKKRQPATAAPDFSVAEDACPRTQP